MFTSYYANLRNIKPPLEPVAISIGLPRFMKWPHRRELRLAPTRAMLKMSREEYDRHFFAQLASLDPRAIAESLGENAVLLCFERPGLCCHRRAVAEWLEQALGVVIPEFGFFREVILPYNQLPDK
jgi:hypothetical protein